jgi:hypothetical protein
MLLGLLGIVPDISGATTERCPGSCQTARMCRNRAAKPNEVVNSTGSWSEAEEAPNNAQLSNELASGYRILISFELLLPNARAATEIAMGFGKTTAMGSNVPKKIPLKCSNGSRNR